MSVYVYICLHICLDNKAEHEQLISAMQHTRHVLSNVDRQVDVREKEHKLFDIYNKLDARQSTVFKGKKFKVCSSQSNMLKGNKFNVCRLLVA